MATIFRGPSVGQPAGKPSRVPQSAQADVSSNGVLSTLVGQDALPFRQTDWPLPLGKPSRVVVQSAEAVRVNSLLVNLAGTDALPFRQGDWPLPQPKAASRELRTHAPTAFLALTATPVTPVRPIDWPLPQLKTRTVMPKSYRPASAAPVARVPFPFSSVFDLPVLSRYPTALRTFLRPYDAFLVPAVIGVQPFVVTDWPLPLGKSYPIELRTFAPAPSVNLAGKDALPLGLDDWPVPQGKRAQSELRTFVDALNLVLLSKDAFFGVAGQPQTTFAELPPIGKPYPTFLRTWVQSLQTSTLPTVGQPPLFSADWPLPAAKGYPVALRTFIGYYVGDTSAPFAQTDWPLPQGKVFDRQLRTWVDTLKLLLTGVDKLPFGLFDWPAPTGKSYDRQLRTWVDRIALGLAGRDAFPARLSEWPLPAGKSFPSELRSFMGRTNLEVIGGDILPFRQNEWPNPQGKDFAAILRTWIASRDLLLKDQFYGVAGEPPTPFDWFVPRGKAYPIELRTLINILTLTTLFPTFRAEWAVNTNAYLGPSMKQPVDK